MRDPDDGFSESERYSEIELEEVSPRWSYANDSRNIKVVKVVDM